MSWMFDNSKFNQPDIFVKWDFNNLEVIKITLMGKID